MKRLSFLPLAALGLLSLASCSQDDSPIQGQEEGNVHLTVSMPGGIDSRQFSTGTSATQLQYAIYEHGKTEPLKIIVQEDESLGTKGTATFINKKATVNLTLAKSKNYDIVFWAQNPDVNVYTFDETKQTVTTNFAGVPVNDDNYDAFTAHYTTGAVNGPITETVTLYRPFAQLNIGTNDVDKALAAGLTVESVDVAVNCYNTLNLMNDEVGVDGDFSPTVTVPQVIYGVAPRPDTDTYTFPVENYEYLSMNYLLVPRTNTNVDVKFYCNRSTVASYTTPFATFDNVPVMRNHRTNIYGALLTEPAVFNVVIDESFDNPDLDYDVKGWDGTVSTGELPKAEDNKTVVLDKPQDLALFAQQINDGTLPKNTPANLTSDMDLNFIEWTPIVKYTGNFDAQGHTIKNLSITKASGKAGFFDILPASSKIKNLTIENVYITNAKSSDGTGAVAGNPYTASMENITIKGDIFITAARYVGVVGGHDAYGNYTNITVDANPGSYVRATSTSTFTPAHCGGVIGFCGEGGQTFRNMTSNIDVVSAGPGAGGIFGTLQYGNNVESCSYSGNVTLLDVSRDIYAQAIGGIAGDYVTGADIHVNNCTFTGTLSATLSGNPFTNFLNGGLVGISYGGTWKGFGVTATNLYINGVNKPYPAN